MKKLAFNLVCAVHFSLVFVLDLVSSLCGFSLFFICDLFFPVFGLDLVSSLCGVSLFFIRDLIFLLLPASCFAAHFSFCGGAVLLDFVVSAARSFPRSACP
jgi:hypothetical protein